MVARYCSPKYVCIKKKQPYKLSQINIFVQGSRKNMRLMKIVQLSCNCVCKIAKNSKFKRSGFIFSTNREKFEQVGFHL